MGVNRRVRCTHSFPLPLARRGMGLLRSLHRNRLPAAGRADGGPDASGCHAGPRVAAPPTSCQLLGFRTAGNDGRSELWILHAEELLQFAQHIKPGVRSTIPIAILRTIVQDVAEADVNMTAPAECAV